MNLETVLGIDLGGTKMAAALIARDGAVLWEGKIATEASLGLERVIHNLASLIDQAAAVAAPTVISLAMPGPLDIPRGIVVKAPTLGWENVPIVTILEEATGIKVLLENDCNAAALGEQVYGAGQGISDLIYITVSTGIGGGFVVNNQIVHGRDGGAGEIGHICAVENGPLCACGKSGCLETLASGTSLARIVVERLRHGEKSTVTKLVSGDLARVNAQIIGEAAKCGDLLAIEVITNAMKYLGITLANLVNIFNPGILVIGGGVTNLGRLVFDPITAEIQKLAYPSFVKNLRIVPPVLEGRAGVLGAAAVALQFLGC